MAARATRPIIVSLAAASVVALALVLVARGHAGSQRASFSTFAAPTQVTSSTADQTNTALAGAKFTPNGLSNSGAATHVVITLQLPLDVPPVTVVDPSPITVTACPGSSAVDNLRKTATCNIGSVSNGQTARLLVTYTAPTRSTIETATIDGSVTWDVPSGGGKTGGTNSLTPSPAGSVTIYPTSDRTHAGTCSSLTDTSDTISSLEPTTGKGTSVTYGRVDSSSGFPCTPAQTGVDKDTSFRGFTPGVWSILFPPLTGGALANATLTLNSLPSGTNWKKFQLFELDASGNPTIQVLACPLTGTQDSCITGRSNFGQGGVELFLNVQGSLVDPSYTG